MTLERRLLLGGAYLLTFLTGAAALIYQVTWQRYMTRLAGGDALATATVLGVFLGGLSLGYRIFGRRTLTSRRPLRDYAVLEALVGVWAMGFPWIFSVVDGLTGSWSFAPGLPLVAQASVAAVLLIGVPTVCMGATVPMLTRAFCDRLSRATPVHARIYACNTAGAFVGALAAGFLLIEGLGLPGTLRVAGALNLAVALLFAVAAARTAAVDSPRAAGQPPPHPGARLLFAISALSGFYVMSLETVLIRLTSLSLGSSGYAFALVVAAFVLCMAVGAFWVSGRARIAPSALAINQLLVAGGLILVLLTFDRWTYVAHRLRIGFGTGDADFLGFHTAAFGALLAAVALPVVSIGATLPLVFDALKRELERIGDESGRVFAWNALGSLLGALGGGYLAFVWLGNGGVLLLAISLAAATAALASSLAGRPTRIAAAVALLLAALLAITTPYDAKRFAVGTFRLRQPIGYSRDGAALFYRKYYAARDVLAFREDPQGTFAVVENPRPAEALSRAFPGLARSLAEQLPAEESDAPPPRSIVVNGKADSSTWYDRETLKLAAHIPALLANRRDRVLVVGLGTGVTAGELALYPDVGRIDVAEIAGAVVDLLPYFEASNRSVASDGRLAVHRGDAFRLIRRTEERWDIVTSEPSNPWVNGVDQLFSREFYRAVRERLEPDGLFLQWAQRYSTNERIVALVVDTLRTEFPHIRAYRAGADMLLLASTRRVEADRLAQAAATLGRFPEVRASLAEIGIAGIGDLMARQDRPFLQRVAVDSPGHVETLDRPRIHYLAGRAFFRGEALEDLR